MYLSGDAVNIFKLGKWILEVIFLRICCVHVAVNIKNGVLGKCDRSSPNLENVGLKVSPL
jgi:hypothetical protein